jgi:Predicted transcriptional regulators
MPKQDYYEKGQLPDLAYLILVTLTKPRHGYLIMGEIELLTNGEVRIGPASLYTTLKRLTEAEFIEQIDNTDKKKVYQITKEGIDTLRIEIQKRKRLADYGESVLSLMEGGYQ